MSESNSSVKNLVLVGGGHSHVEVLRNFAVNPIKDVRITLVCRDRHTPYSGMLPGLIAGHYNFDETHIDLEPLAQYCNAEFLQDEVIGLDPARKQVLCADHPPLSYDLLSINIGSAPATRQVPGADEYTVPVKPISRFFAHWERMRTRLLEEQKATHVAVVGGGAGGVELLLAMQFRLRQDRSAKGLDTEKLHFHLVTDKDSVLPTHDLRVQNIFTNELNARGIQIHNNCRVNDVRSGKLFCENGEALTFDEILWVTSAGAARWPAVAGLDTDTAGFIAVCDTLQSTSHPEIYAAGDIAAMIDHPRPKSGAVAVRQGPPLAENLRRHLQGMPARPYIPQPHYLAIISTGNRYAVATRGKWTMTGHWMWRFKDWIDRRFITKYSDLPH